MKKIIEYALKHSVSVMMYLLLLILLGAISFSQIPMDYLPVIKDRSLLVSTIFEGFPAEQMQEIITIPVENTFSSLKGIKNISSVTRDSVSLVKLQLHYGTNINSALLEANQLADDLIIQLPEACSKPKIEIYQSDRNKLLSIIIIPKKISLTEASHHIETDIKHSLQMIPGVGKIRTTGTVSEEIQITYDMQKLAALKLSPQNIVDSIHLNNYEFPAGLIKDEQNEYIFTTSCLYKSLDEIRNTVILSGETSTTLSSLAEIRQTIKDKDNFCHFNGTDCIELILYKKSDANPVKVSRDIVLTLNKLKNDYSFLDFKIIRNTTCEIKKSIYSIIITSLTGTFLTFLLLLYFYRNLKISLLICISIPVSILFSFLILFINGRSINFISLSGISISIGMAVDTSIIVIDNLSSSSKSNHNSLSHTYNTICKCLTSIIGSTLTTIIAFLPFLLFPGVFGEIFSDLSIAVISSISCSTLYAISIIPASINLNPKLKFDKQNSIIINRLNYHYSNYLKNYNSFSKLSVLAFLILILLSLIALPFIKKEIFPGSSKNTLTFTITYPQNHSITAIELETKKLIQKLKTLIPSTDFLSQAGFNTNDFTSLSDHHNSPNKASIFIPAINKHNKNIILSYLDNQNIQYSISDESNLISKALDLTSSTYFHHPDKKLISKVSKSLQSFSPDYNVTETVFTPDSDKIAFYKIPKYEISNQLFIALNGTECSSLIKKDQQIPIVVKASSQDSKVINNIYIHHNNYSHPIKNLGSISFSKVPKILFRYNRNYAVESPETINISSVNTTSLLKENLKEISISSFFLLILVLILIYAILGIQTESFSLPVLLMLSILPGISGGIITIAAFRQSLNLNTLLSLIIITGISINNSLILFENYDGKSKSISKLQNSASAVFITTITSIVSIIPLALNISSEQASMAICLCGGIITSFFSSMTLMPFILNKTLYRKES